MSAPVSSDDPLSPPLVSPGRFRGSRVVVTGAAQGIGMAVAARIAMEGGHVIGVDRSTLVEDVCAQISSLAHDGGRADPLTADLETWEGAEAVAKKAGTVDVLVNNVGGTIWARPYSEYSPEQIEAEIRRSLFPTLWMCRAILPAMAAAGAGTIVNVSSVATRGVNRVPYAASKGGVNAITAALALESAPHGVRVVATAPGGTLAPERKIARGGAPESKAERRWYQEIVDQTVDSSLLKRYGTLHEQAAPICFLASSEASYIDGSVLPVGGGDQG